MIRTQVFLTEEQYRRVQLTAKKEQRPASEVIREALEKGLQTKQGAKTAGDALLGLAALGKKLNFRAEPDFSAKIDDYLYGDK